MKINDKQHRHTAGQYEDDKQHGHTAGQYEDDKQQRHCWAI